MDQRSQVFVNDVRTPSERVLAAFGDTFGVSRVPYGSGETTGAVLETGPPTASRPMRSYGTLLRIRPAPGQHRRWWW